MLQHENSELPGPADGSTEQVSPVVTEEVDPGTHWWFSQISWVVGENNQCDNGQLPAVTTGVICPVLPSVGHQSYDFLCCIITEKHPRHVTA